jgi:DNA-binding IclR family transcriptional regulator
MRELGRCERELRNVRRRGLARQTPGAFHGNEVVINALSTPVVDASGSAVLAITAVGDAERFGAQLDNPFARPLRATREELPRRLGYGVDVDATPAKQPITARG